MKCKQPRPGIELGFPCLLPTLITNTLRALLFIFSLSLSLYIYIYIYIYACVRVCVCVCTNFCTLLSHFSLFFHFFLSIYHSWANCSPWGFLKEKAGILIFHRKDIFTKEKKIFSQKKKKTIFSQKRKKKILSQKRKKSTFSNF